ncbi:MAG: hypothetical protein K6F92_00310 [Lachnospiraceae bacterium]|nr:hypothetical protein [Lachnospiraceae bacterium]
MKKRLYCAVASCLIVCGGCAADVQAPQAISTKLIEPAAAGVVVATAQCRDIKSVSYREGYVVPVIHELGFYVSGVVGTCNVAVGDMVNKYDVLGVLDESEAISTIDEKTTDNEYLNLKYEYALAVFDAETEELTALIENVSNKIAAGTATSEEMKEAELAALKMVDRDKTREKILSDWAYANEQFENEIAYINVPITKNILITEYDGMVINCEITKGSSVNAGQSVIRIADLGQSYIQLNDSSMTDISKAGFELYADVNAYINGECLGVSFKGVDGAGNTCLNIEGDTELNNGDYVMVEFVSAQKLSVLSVPSETVFTEGSQSYVYKLVDGVRNRVDIVTGMTDGMYTEITSGDIEEGDEIYVPQ